MKFAFSANAFRNYSLAYTIAALADAGYEGIEIMADMPHAYPPSLTGADIRDIRLLLDRRHMEISNINAFMLHAESDTYHPSWIEREPRLRDRRVAYTLDCIDLAAQLGAPSISIEPGGPLQGMSFDEGIELFKEGLRAVQDSAQQKGVRVLIEPEPGLLIENSTQFLSLIDDLDPEVFGLNFDIGHFFCVGESCPVLIFTLSRYIDHFHLEDIAASKEHVRLMPGKGAIDLPEVVHAIKNIDYSGFITVELYTYDDRPTAAAQEALYYLERIADIRTTPPFPSPAVELQ